VRNEDIRATHPKVPLLLNICILSTDKGIKDLTKVRFFILCPECALQPESRFNRHFSGPQYWPGGRGGC